MNTVIFRTIAPPLIVIMLLFSVYVLLRGHNEPGGGFIGGLIAAAAIAVLALARGALAAQRALKVDPLAIAGFGVVMAVLSGMASIFTASPFLTSMFATIELGETAITLSTPLFFDIGVYCAVFGTVARLVLTLADEQGEGN